MTRTVTSRNVLNLGLSGDGTRPVLIVDDVRLRADEMVTMRSEDLARFVVGLLAMSADALAEAGEARRRERVN